MEQATIQRTRAFARQLARQGFSEQGRAMQIVSPHLTWGSARVQAHRALTSINGKKVMQEELSKIATPEEIEGFFTSVMRADKERTSDRLKAGELGARVKGMLIERNINENTNIDKSDLESKAAELALEWLKKVDPERNPVEQKA